MIKHLDAEDLKKVCDMELPQLFNSEICTNENEILFIGQERAEKSMLFGLKAKAAGYNIYVSGLPQSGKTTFIHRFAEKIAKNERTPDDLCYIYNFEEPRCPKLLNLPPGIGREFKEDMDELINILCIELPNIFASKEFEDDKDNIVKQYQEKRDLAVKQVQEIAKSYDFGVKMTSSGIYFMPVVDGEIISEEQFDTLSEEEKESISKYSELIQEQAMEVMRQIKDFEKHTHREVDSLEYTIALLCVGRYMSKLNEKYKECTSVIAYLSQVKEDILENLSDFVEQEDDNDESLQSFMPWLVKKPHEDIFSKYRINLLTDNTNKSGAPVILDMKPTYASLTGEVEYDSEYGNFKTDFMKIKPGLLHKANGGYLILQAYDVLANAIVWDALRRVIKTKELAIEPIREYMTGIAVTSIKPEPAKIDIKIILVGSAFYYNLLYDFDDDFQKLFKIHAQFDYNMPYNNQSAGQVAAFIRNYTKQAELPSLDYGAAAKLIEYSARLAQRQDKLTTQFGKLSEIIEEAAIWLSIDGQHEEGQLITSEIIKRTIDEREYRLNMYEEKLSEMIDQSIVMIDTTGEKTAQINGLAVIDTGEYVFAKPSRITATTYIGKAGIINIEKEADMSGSIHDKGVEVISGYLGQKYAQEFPLSLSCRICFEQNYSGIDGDSASSTELYTIMSSLADVPIKQSMAVTGSLSQRGEIQPIGGVTFKIEGFFDLCEKRGLTGEQGVIIPIQNVKDLTLNDAVIDAVRKGKFHIYAITDIDDGIELLTGIPAGEKNGKGKYPVNSIHGRVMKKLKAFHEKAMCED